MTLGFKAFCKGKQPIEIFTAKSVYEAQCMAARLWNMKPSQQYKISIVLCEKDGQPVVHSTTEL